MAILNIQLGHQSTIINNNDPIADSEENAVSNINETGIAEKIVVEVEQRRGDILQFGKRFYCCQCLAGIPVDIFLQKIMIIEIILLITACYY